jgi:hypothetical protein
MTLEHFERVVKKGLYYEADCDDNGARVVTNLPNTICPHCKQGVEPHAEHLCGNRAPKGKTKRWLRKKETA